jgi:hypothetical protein
MILTEKNIRPQKTTLRLVSVLVLCLSVLSIIEPNTTLAQNNKKIVTKSADLDRKEDELIKKEAALLKQLSSSAQDSAAAESETMARIDPPSLRVIPKADSEVAQPNAAVQLGNSSALLAEKERRIETLSQEVSKLRNRLLLAETEVERLSSIIDERNRRQMSSIAQQRNSEHNSALAVAPAVIAKKAPSTNAGAAPAAQDMQVVTVRSEKAHLRTGPGEENSPLMTVSRGTRLAVETRSGNWYRVISPAGTRAWVSADVVVFGDLDPTRTTRIGGFSPQADAFRSSITASKGQ